MFSSYPNDHTSFINVHVNFHVNVNVDTNIHINFIGFRKATTLSIDHSTPISDISHNHRYCLCICITYILILILVFMAELLNDIAINICVDIVICPIIDFLVNKNYFTSCLYYGSYPCSCFSS